MVEVTRVAGDVVGGATVEVPLVGGSGVVEALVVVGGMKKSHVIP